MDHDPLQSHFEMPKFYLDNYKHLIETIDKSATLNQSYGGKMKGVRSSELETKS